jgi:hypothetical protein
VAGVVGVVLVAFGAFRAGVNPNPLWQTVDVCILVLGRYLMVASLLITLLGFFSFIFYFYFPCVLSLSISVLFPLIFYYDAPFLLLWSMLVFVPPIFYLCYDFPFPISNALLLVIMSSFLLVISSPFL